MKPNNQAKSHQTKPVAKKQRTSATPKAEPSQVLQPPDAPTHRTLDEFKALRAARSHEPLSVTAPMRIPLSVLSIVAFDAPKLLGVVASVVEDHEGFIHQQVLPRLRHSVDKSALLTTVLIARQLVYSHHTWPAKFDLPGIGRFAELNMEDALQAIATGFAGDAGHLCKEVFVDKSTDPLTRLEWAEVLYIVREWWNRLNSELEEFDRGALERAELTALSCWGDRTTDKVGRVSVPEEKHPSKAALGATP